MASSTDPAGKIHFHSLSPALRLTNRTYLKRFIARVFKSEKKLLKELTVVFCSDTYLLRINQKYLNHNDYTDVITFDLSDGKAGICGEIYISVDRVKENARFYRVSQAQELHRVIFHGILHLCGYKDKSPRQAIEIRARENECLQKYSQFVSRETRST